MCPLPSNFQTFQKAAECSERSHCLVLLEEVTSVETVLCHVDALFNSFSFLLRVSQGNIEYVEHMPEVYKREKEWRVLLLGGRVSVKAANATPAGCDLNKTRLKSWQVAAEASPKDLDPAQDGWLLVTWQLVILLMDDSCFHPRFSASALR